MGRNAKPIDLQLAEGNPNRLTKAEIERRKKAEIKLGSSRIKCPDFIKNDTIAYKKWRELIKIYKESGENGVELIASSDIGLLSKYCKTWSEYMKLLGRRDRIDNARDITLEDEEIIAECTSEDTAKWLLNKVNYIISTEGVLKLDTAINKKMDMLIKMEDRLFLNPLAKVKNIPKKEEKPPANKFAKYVG